MLSISYDFSSLLAAVTRIREVMRRDAISTVADTYIRELPLLYAKGIGGDGVPLPPYNEAYALRLGIPTLPKTLERGEKRLYALQKDGDMVTVVSAPITRTTKKGTTHSTDARTVAYGQQTGGSGRWSHSNPMFGVNADLQHTAAIDLYDHVISHLALAA